MPLEKAATEAIRRCARNGIPDGFLTEHASEAMNTLLDEWNLDEAKEVWFEERQEKGWEMAEAKHKPIIAENQKLSGYCGKPG